MLKKMLLLAAMLPGICFAAHPLASDDTGTQGASGMQFELNTDAARRSDGPTLTRNQQINATLTYGLTDTLDVALNLPHQRIAVEGMPADHGIGDVGLIMKWRFWEMDGFSLGLKPQILLPTGDQQRGLGNGKPSYGANLLASWDEDRLTLLANAGYAFSNADSIRKHLWNVSAAALWKIEPRVKAILDTGLYRNPDPASNRNPAFAIVGLIYSPNKDLDFDIGYRKGLNHAEVDHGAGIGLTLRW